MGLHVLRTCTVHSHLLHLHGDRQLQLFPGANGCGRGQLHGPVDHPRGHAELLPPSGGSGQCRNSLAIPNPHLTQGLELGAILQPCGVEPCVQVCSWQLGRAAALCLRPGRVCRGHSQASVPLDVQRVLFIAHLRGGDVERAFFIELTDQPRGRGGGVILVQDEGPLEHKGLSNQWGPAAVQGGANHLDVACRREYHLVGHAMVHKVRVEAGPDVDLEGRGNAMPVWNGALQQRVRCMVRLIWHALPVIHRPTSGKLGCKGQGCGEVHCIGVGDAGYKCQRLLLLVVQAALSHAGEDCLGSYLDDRVDSGPGQALHPMLE
mmetsp:Transcript_103490/g.178311  ORF Transcript_103490/g.178311 Transcript_103490/m.178311 type:complete len:320 (+) Transcript_103490:3220-4179(+)